MEVGARTQILLYSRAYFYPLTSQPSVNASQEAAVLKEFREEEGLYYRLGWTSRRNEDYHHTGGRRRRSIQNGKHLL